MEDVVPPMCIGTGLTLAQGINFDREGTLYCVDVYGGGIGRMLPGGALREWVNTGGGPNGSRFGPNGDLFIADCVRKAMLRFSTAQETVYAAHCDGRPFRGPNDLCFGPDGTLYFTDPTGFALAERIGAVYAVAPDGRARPLPALRAMAPCAVTLGLSRPLAQEETADHGAPSGPTVPALTWRGRARPHPSPRPWRSTLMSTRRSIRFWRHSLAVVAMVTALSVGATPRMVQAHALRAAPPQATFVFGREGGNIRPYTVTIYTDGTVTASGPVSPDAQTPCGGRGDHRRLAHAGPGRGVLCSAHPDRGPRLTRRGRTVYPHSHAARH
jgi:SMP-30/Gluconolactonase/LRE-like region